jgi:hypothetical protein
MQQTANALNANRMKTCQVGKMYLMGGEDMGNYSG